MLPAGSVRRSFSLRAAVVVVAIGAAVALAGCSGSGSDGSTSSPKPSHSKTTSKPKPTPTPTFAALKYTCNSILPPATLQVFTSKQSAGFTLQNDYLQRMENIGSNLVMFNTYGGILCQWAYPDAANSVDYAFSPITSDQATTQQATLTSTGYVGTQKDHGTLYANTDTADYPDEYLFIDGYWFQASSDNLMQLIVDNVFVTGS
ncbi:MAG TPA: hypothetical protein VHZ81_03925 [Galbitalea sp.]|jgi:hypothetical protein|nr:hypothetical protein [Galbitalea sp.]